jgi:RHH-type proline utilization regulon transcriptional repressor/proline dehydrogenase/delta 1-pyrroline-5-carboxylate dehydrogenase
MLSSPSEPGTRTATAEPSLADETVALVQTWLMAAAEIPADRQAARLANVLRDRDGLAFAVGFIDGVIRPEDTRVAARNLAQLVAQVPQSLPWYLRFGVRLAGVAGAVFPRLVIPVVRRTLRGLVGHLIVDASERNLGRAIRKLRRNGTQLNLNLLGEAVLGDREAARRLAGTEQLVTRADVDHVSIKVSSTHAPHADWAFDARVADVVEALTPLFEKAATHGPTFINLDMEEYRDLEVTVSVFTALLDQPSLLTLEAGIVLQAYLPDALGAMIRLQEWAAARRARGGAPIRVRVVKGANLPMERVEASLHDWPLATWATKQETDTNFKRILDYALDSGRAANIGIGIASHNLFDLAHAWLLAGRRDVRDRIQFEMLLGMAQGQAEVVRRETGGLLLYTPVVHPGEFDVAIAYLVRRLEEGASGDNFMSAVFEIGHDEALFAREQDRFLASLDALDREVPSPRRTQDRNVPIALGTSSGFRNAQDSDPALPVNRRWADRILARVPGSPMGIAAVRAHTVHSSSGVERVLAIAAEHADPWGALTGHQRATVLHHAGDLLEHHRADLLEVMAAETGKTLDQGDPEVSEAIDFAHYYAERARDLDALDGAEFVPSRITVVTPPWNFPVAIPAGSVLAALAAGSSVVLKPAPQAARCGSVLAEILWAAGVSREVLQLVHVEEGTLGRQLISDPRVDRVILTGAYETAELFRSFRADLPLLAETSGKNAIVVMPSADLDLAVKDVVRSAFGHAGQKCSAASLVILVGSVAGSRRFRDQLVDATTSLRVGPASDPRTQVGPLIEPASGKLLRALTELDDGESWIVRPRQLDDSGCLWSPGIRGGVVRGSMTHRTEFFGPVLGVMTARTLDEAIELQNEVDYGLTAGLHSLEPSELAVWLDQVEAGNLYVNRSITGAIVQRQPFGGWKRSTVGTGFKAGGPNYLFGLGQWTSVPSTAGASLGPAAARLLAAATGRLSPEVTAWLSRAVASDALVWSEEFGIAADVSRLAAEQNVLRYRATPVVVRLGEGGDPIALIRVLAAGRLAGSPMTVTTCNALPPDVDLLLTVLGLTSTVLTDDAWLDWIATSASLRIRLIDGDASALLEHLGGRPDITVHSQPVTESGRVELLPFIAEQSVSITGHRFGSRTDLTAGLL